MTRSQPEDDDNEYVGSVWTVEEVTGGWTVHVRTSRRRHVRGCRCFSPRSVRGPSIADQMGIILVSFVQCRTF